MVASEQRRATLGVADCLVRIKEIESIARVEHSRISEHGAVERCRIQETQRSVRAAKAASVAQANVAEECRTRGKAIEAAKSVAHRAIAAEQRVEEVRLKHAASSSDSSATARFIAAACLGVLAGGWARRPHQSRTWVQARASHGGRTLAALLLLLLAALGAAIRSAATLSEEAGWLPRLWCFAWRRLVWIPCKWAGHQAWQGACERWLPTLLQQGTGIARVPRQSLDDEAAGVSPAAAAAAGAPVEEDVPTEEAPSSVDHQQLQEGSRPAPAVAVSASSLPTVAAPLPPPPGETGAAPEGLLPLERRQGRLHDFLDQWDLTMYTTALAEWGYDEKVMKLLDENEKDEMFRLISCKPGHKVRFRRLLEGCRRIA